MSGTLYVVATPIGNLEDVTFRALRVLREVAVIAAEDTRRTARLLQHYSISTPTTSLHEHNERARLRPLIERLLAGQSVALVSDAGTPLVSDPGALLVAAAHGAGIRVEPVPGPSAALALVSCSGFAPAPVLILGFPPRRSKDRKGWFEALLGAPRLGVFFEAPHRIRASLSDLLDVVGDRRVAVGCELTKRHETLVVRTISEAIASLSEPRGEFTIAVEPMARGGAAFATVPDAADLATEFCHIAKQLPSKREAVRQIAKRYGRPVREIYNLLTPGTDDK
jgi:16S rRNA (cytidine1402-2'-O)-methyltransferase